MKTTRVDIKKSSDQLIQHLLHKEIRRKNGAMPPIRDLKHGGPGAPRTVEVKRLSITIPSDR